MLTGQTNFILYLLGLALWFVGSVCLADTTHTIQENISGNALMEQVYKRHQQFPYIYEEQSLVMEDDNGQRDTRRAKRYTRIEPGGTVKFLLLFDYPEEIRGVAVLAERHPDGHSTRHVYLPALGEVLKETVGGAGESNFLGTDFSVENLTGEDLSQYRYVKKDDEVVDGIEFHVLDVYRENASDKSPNLDTPLRRHFIRRDTLFITLTHHYDRLGRISRVQSWHDLRPVAGSMWRADMILMVDKKEQHQSLIKVSRRIYSKDYVPEEVFTPEWLYRNYPYVEPVLEDAQRGGDSAKPTLSDNSLANLTIEEIAKRGAME